MFKNGLVIFQFRFPKRKTMGEKRVTNITYVLTIFGIGLLSGHELALTGG